MSLSTHVLDSTLGRPATGVAVSLEQADGSGWRTVATGHTDTGGRLRDWLPDGEPAVGVYRLVFDTGAYFEATGTHGFYPEVVVTFHISDPGSHYHVPLLLSPHSYTTYRGS